MPYRQSQICDAVSQSIICTICITHKHSHRSEGLP